MSRTTFHLIAGACWLVFAGMAVAAWPSFVERFGENAEEYGGAIIFFAALAGVLLQAFLADRMVSRDQAVKKESDEERLARAQREAEKELRAGGFRRAIQIYEGAGFIMKALQVAEEHGDREAMARLLLRLGKHARAAGLFRELGKLEAAAHTLVLAGSPKEARLLYRQAAEQSAAAGPAALAALWNRAGEPGRAAPLYEEAGDLKRSAECHDLAGNPEGSRALAERAAVIEAYERRKDGPSKKPALVDEKKDARDAAEVMASVGDLFGAAEAWRDAEEYRKAANAFEKVEEWERAARCHEKLGDAARAGELRALAEATAPPRTEAPKPVPQQARPAANNPPTAPTTAAPPAPSSPPPMLMAPSSLQAAPFMSVADQAVRLVPLFVPVAVQPGAAPPAGTAPVSAHELATMFEMGNYAAIARAPVAPQVWMEAARDIEARGSLAAAADLYRSMGRIENARHCLERANRPVDAAMLALASGDRRGAHKILRARLDERPDREAGLMLGELLIETGRYFQALRVLHETLAPEGCTESNASLFYHFARRFEDAGAHAEARALYGEMLASGATSHDLSERIERLARLSGVASPPIADDSPRRSAEDFLKAAIGDDTSSPEQRKAPAPPTRPFPFSPPSLRGRIPTATAGGAAAAEKAPPLVLRDISLFGNVHAAPTESAAASTAAPPTTAAPAVQPRVDPFAPAQRYELVRELGRGGMGVVYEARDRTLGRPLVIKLIGNAQSDSRAIEQFLMEARAVARLSHRNIVTIYDFGMMDLQHYIAMEMVRGKDLKTRIETRERLPPREALRFFVEIAKGLDAAHKAGVVHRDIKPANVLLNEHDEVRIVDFGLAKLADASRVADENERSLFRTAGTPGYMAPEQIRGEEPMPACDIYALGMTLFCMLVGKPPHRAVGISGTRSIIDFQMDGNYPSIGQFVPGIPPVVEQVYSYCTKARREERYQSVDAFVETIEQWTKVL